MITLTINQQQDTADVSYPNIEIVTSWSKRRHGDKYNHLALGFLTWHPNVKQFKVITINQRTRTEEVITKQKSQPD